MTTDTGIPSESQESQEHETKKCTDCGGYRTAICETCRDMSEYTAAAKPKGKRPKGKLVNGPSGPVAVTYTCSACGQVFNDLDKLRDHKMTAHPEAEVPEALDALEKCKHHGEAVELKDGVAFCAVCHLALSCADCNDVNDCERCPGCSGKPKQEIAGDMYIPIKLATTPEQGTVTPAPGEGTATNAEADWSTYHDRAAPVPDPMLEEGKGEPAMAEDVTANPLEPQGKTASVVESQALVPVARTDEPWWTGGPLDSVTPEGGQDGADPLPWNIAVLKCPVGRYCRLTKDKYNYGGIEAVSIGDMDVPGGMDPDTVIQHMLLAAEQASKAEVEEQSRQEYQGGDTGQSTIDGEPMVRGSLETIDVEQVKATVDKFILRTTREGLDNALSEEKMSLEQWVYHKMRPLTMDTYISGEDWAIGCKQLLKVIKGAA